MFTDPVAIKQRFVLSMWFCLLASFCLSVYCQACNNTLAAVYYILMSLVFVGLLGLERLGRLLELIMKQ